MIFYASLRRELAQSFTGVLVVLLSIVMTMMLIRTLSLAARGSLNPQDLFLIMAYLTLSFSPTILTLSLFVSVSSCLVRWYQDSEMAVWFSSGQSLLNFFRPIFGFAWPILLAITLLGLFAWPWANQQITQLRSSFSERSDIERIAPGEFQSNRAGTRVFFSEPGGSQDASGQVFIYGEKNQRRTITVAQGGKLERGASGEISLVLFKGQSMNENQETGHKNISAFERYRTVIENQPNHQNELGPLKAQPNRLLLGSAEGRGELSWRIGMVLSACNFILLALLLIKNTQRSGKGSHMLLILMSFAVYYNLITFGKNWVAKEQISLLLWLLLLHGGVAIGSLLLLLHKQGSLRSVWNGKSA